MAKAASTEAEGDTRDLIVRAALAAFSERGFDGATTRDIASRAGVNHGLIPYYFGSKPKLWRAAVDRAFDELETALSGVVGDPAVTDPHERARRMVRGYVRFVAQHPEFVRLMHEEGKRTGPRMRWLVDRHAKPLFEAVSGLMRQAQSSGLLPAEIAPVHLHYILAGSVGVIFEQSEECKRLTGLDPFDEAAVEDHARAVEYLFFGPADEAAENERPRAGRALGRKGATP